MLFLVKFFAVGRVGEIDLFEFVGVIFIEFWIGFVNFSVSEGVIVITGKVVEFNVDVIYFVFIGKDNFIDGVVVFLFGYSS